MDGLIDVGREGGREGGMDRRKEGRRDGERDVLRDGGERGSKYNEFVRIVLIPSLYLS